MQIKYNKLMNTWHYRGHSLLASASVNEYIC